MIATEMVTGAAAGEPQAFRALVRDSWRFVYSICLSQLGHTWEAEDRTQEVFLAVYRDLGDLRDPTKFLPWLRRVTLNACRSHLRRTTVPPTSFEDTPELADPSASADLRRGETRRMVEGTLA